MINKIYFVLLLCSINLLSCFEQNYKRQNIRSIVNEMNGREIKIPEKVYFTKYITDTIKYDFEQSDYKLLFYADSIGCLECKLKLNRWKHLILDFNSISNVSISYLFFINIKDTEKIKEILYENEFDHPICIDINGEFRKINYILEDDHFHVFLLNRNNCIVAIGNPVKNDVIKDLYKKIILKNY